MWGWDGSVGDGWVIKLSLQTKDLHPFTQQSQQIGDLQAPTVYRVTFAPVLSLPLLPLSAGQFKTWRTPMSQILSLFKHDNVWANSRRGEIICKWIRAKITRGKNNPVYNGSLCLYNESMQKEIQWQRCRQDLNNLLYILIHGWLLEFCFLT